VKLVTDLPIKNGSFNVGLDKLSTKNRMTDRFFVPELLIQTGLSGQTILRAIF